MVMIRNPRAETTYNGTWSINDTKYWNDDLINQVPFGINPLKAH